MQPPAETPTKPGAYMDSKGKIWLLEKSRFGHMQWRLPGGVITLPGNPLFSVAFKDAAPLVRMIVPRRAR